MRDFNYVDAWFALPLPEVQELSKPMRALFHDTREALQELYQNEGLLIPAPDEVRARFATFSTEELARASRALYFFGHWSPFPESNMNGSCWKFSNVADQVVRARLLGTPKHEGKSLIKTQRLEIFAKVIEGETRICVSSDTRGSDYWLWREVALADAPLPEQEIIELFRSRIVRGVLDYTTAEELLKELRSRLGRGLWNTDVFYGSKANTDCSRQAAKHMTASGWTVPR